MSEPETKYEVAVKAMLEEHKADTPETDLIRLNYNRHIEQTINEVFKHAEKLERERNEARREAESYRDMYEDGEPEDSRSIFPWEEE